MTIGQAGRPLDRIPEKKSWGGEKKGSKKYGELKIIGKKLKSRTERGNRHLGIQCTGISEGKPVYLSKHAEEKGVSPE